MYYRIYPAESGVIQDADSVTFWAEDDETAISRCEEVAEALSVGRRLILRRASSIAAIAEWRGQEDGTAMRVY